MCSSGESEQCMHDPDAAQGGCIGRSVLSHAQLHLRRALSDDTLNATSCTASTSSTMSPLDQHNFASSRVPRHRRAQLQLRSRCQIHIEGRHSSQQRWVWNIPVWSANPKPPQALWCGLGSPPSLTPPR